MEWLKSNGHKLTAGLLCFLIALDGMCPEGLSALLGSEGKYWWLFLLSTSTFARCLYLEPVPPDSAHLPPSGGDLPR